MYHNNFDLMYKAPFGAVKADTKVYIRLDVDKNYKSCSLRLWTPEQREEMYEMNYGVSYYDIEIIIDKVGLSWYVFILEDFDTHIRFYGCDQGYTAGKGCDFSTFPRKAGYQITCYDKEFNIPDWFSGNLIYQIFPDRFCRDYTYKFNETKYKKIHGVWNEKLGHTQGGADNFEFYGGNLLGISSKLAYLKELNIDIIYLNPIYKSISNHRYDVSTYLEIDEMLGTMDDFREFIKMCHKSKIRVILDVSWNHVGADSVYFNKYKTFGNYGAYNDINSVYREWFDIQENGNYNSWWGIDTLPVLNKNNQSFKFHVNQVVEHWISQGIDGFRLDVIDELPDDFLEWFRKIVKRTNNDLVIVGETWEDASMKKDWSGKPRSYLYGYNQDSVMNYPLRNMLIDFLSYGCGEKEIIHYNIDADTFYRKYMNLYSNYPKEIFYALMNFLSTHDINRAILMFSDCPYNGNLSKQEQEEYVISSAKYEIAIKRLKIAWSFIMYSIGTPSLYYGDESGLYGYNDPFNRQPMNWGTEDIDLLNWFKEINGTRTKYPVTKNGEMKFLFAHGDIIAFERYDEKSKLIYIANRSCETIQVTIESNKFEIKGLSYHIQMMN